MKPARPQPVTTSIRRDPLSQRALTLVELLAALALLGLISAAGTTLLKSMVQASAKASARTQWMHAAQAVLDSIGQDLSIGDFDAIGDRARGTPRVTVSPGESGSTASLVVQIRTRSDTTGPCLRRYVVVGDRLIVEVLPVSHRIDAGAHRPGAPTALGGVTEFAATLDPASRVLSVRIRTDTATIAARCFLLPSEELP